MKNNTGKRLLAIDDDPDILRVLKANLELHGFKVSTADTWESAKKLLDEQLPDLIILDLILPDEDGINIGRYIKGRYARLPVIMLTARDRISDKVTGFECGADDYVVKPFETLELIARIKACLRRSAAAEERKVIRDLSIDFKTREVYVCGSRIELTPRQYELLRLLALNIGEPVSREMIRKTLWRSSDIYSWSRVIDVHVRHLRKKIERDPAQPEYIITVSGFGYKLKQ